MARTLWWIARARSITPLPRRSENAAAIASFVAAVVVSAALLFVPAYTEESSTIVSPSTEGVISKIVVSHPTLIQVNGVRALLTLAVPVLIAGLPLLFRRSRWRALLEASAAALLTALTVIAGFSIGLFYLPSAVAMLVAALLARPAHASG
jgi:hypothetical protein